MGVCRFTRFGRRGLRDFSRCGDASVGSLNFVGHGPGGLFALWAWNGDGRLSEAVLLLIAIVLLRLAIPKLWVADLAASVLFARD
jgi:hypothetical protein